MRPDAEEDIALDGNAKVNAKVLVADDDETIRSMLEAVLQEDGFYLTTAASVPEALKLISSNAYALLLSDFHMPGAGDGLAVVSAMGLATPKAVTLSLSAFPERDAVGRAIRVQADQILVKPM